MRTSHCVACIMWLVLPGVAQVAAPPVSSEDSEKSKQKCELEGQVISLTTEVPLQKVTVKLRKSVSPITGAGAMADEGSYSANSDAVGKFRFDNVEPGSYLLSAERTGYVRESHGSGRSSYTGAVFTLRNGQHLKNLILRLTPQATLAGRIVEDDSESVPAVLVQALRVGYLRGTKQLLPVGMATSNADGTYVIGGLSPGRYIVKASGKPPMVIPGINDRLGADSGQKSFVTTYYPNTLEAVTAAPTYVAAGAEVRGVDIRLRKSTVFRISGKALDTRTGMPAQKLMIVLMSAETSDALALFDSSKTIVRNSDGSFEFRQVAPGRYIIQPLPGQTVRSAESGELVDSRLSVGRLAVDVVDRNLDDVVLELRPSAEITGRVVFEEEGSRDTAGQSGLVAPGTQPGNQVNSQQSGIPGIMPSISISLQPVNGTFGTVLNTQSKQNGTFILRGMSLEKFRVKVAGLPDGVYVKSILFGHEDVTKKPLDLTADAGKSLDVGLSRTAATLTGVARNAKGDVVPGATISLWSQTPAESDANESATTVSADQNGIFRLGNLAPGQFLVAAWEDIDPGIVVSAAFCARFESKAASIRLEAGSTRTVEVTLIGRNASDAEIARLQ